MKAIVELDVPEWQDDQEVSVYFPDTMVKHARCKSLAPKAVVADRWVETYPLHYERKGFCPECSQAITYLFNRAYCGYCGQAVVWND